MDQNRCALDCLQDSRIWAQTHFGRADLGDVRLDKRLVELVTGMADNPAMSLPKQFPDWSDLTAAYRFFSHPDVRPADIVAPHRSVVRELSCSHPVVLCVQDDTQLDFTNRTDLCGLGQIGNGFGKGLLQHSSLAVLPDGRLLGVLDLAWHAVEKAKKGETRRERQARWGVADVWHEAAGAVGVWPAGSVLVHVGDRHADLFRFLSTATRLGQHFVVRAMHDRYVTTGAAHGAGAGGDKTDPEQKRLWDAVADAPSLGQIKVDIGAQRDKGNRIKRDARSATLDVRVAAVTMPPPVNDPRTGDHPPLDVWAVHLLEPNPPAGEDPVEWMLISSLPAMTLELALVLVGYYLCRWIIEQWHRCLKQGCRIEDSQLDDAMDVQRLTAIKAVQAVRLLQIRDLADQTSATAVTPATPATPATPTGADKKKTARGPKSSPAKPSAPTANLSELVPPMYRLIVARLARVDPDQLTPGQFLLTIAKRGGYLARKNDPRPGWIVLWRGWSDVIQMVYGAELYRSAIRE